MMYPPVLTPTPSAVLALVGGLVGTILTSALFQLGPSVTGAFPDVPRLIGGLFTGDPTGAFWLGFWLLFPGGLVIAQIVKLLWASLPGEGIGFGGATVKGLVVGVVLWVVWSLLLPALGALNALEGPGLAPGFFALDAGLLGAAGLLASQLAYGLALALIAAMGQGIRPVDTIGWQGYGIAWVREVAPRRP
jgi:hypothetical protein